MFRGSSSHTIDAKGRVIIPTRYREVIKASGIDGLMITGWDGCLYAYTHEQWAQQEQKILHMREKDEAMRRFQRLFLGKAHDCRCDAQGRVLIPPMLKQYAGLEKEIVLTGVLYRFEIWSRDLWEQQGDLMEKDLRDGPVEQKIAQLVI